MNVSTAQRAACASARLLLFLLACLPVAGPAFAQRPTSGLVAQYPFDGNLEDTTTNSYDGQATGGPTYAAGISGQALNFDGVDDALRISRLPNILFAGDFTVSWYMNAQSLDAWSLLSKRDACTSGNWFEVGGSRAGSDQLGFSLSRTGIGAVVATAQQAYFAPGWVHVAVVRQGAAARVYVDGERGADVTLGTLDVSRINALLGFSASPCIGTGGVRAFRGQLDDLRIYNRALDSREVDALASIPQITPTPGSVSPGGSLKYVATELDVGTTYSLRLFDGAGNPVLDSFAATAAEQRRGIVMPNAAVGRWPLRLQVVSPRGLPIIHASTTLTVSPGLDIAVRTATPQAGKPLQVDVGRLATGRLQLRYAGRIVAGPVDIDRSTTTKSLKFLAPADIPASLPGDVELRAELLSGRVIARTATRTIRVGAAFSGPFALPTGVTSSVPVASERTRVNVRGRLQLADGATPANTDLSVYWIGDDGSMTPLPTHSLSVQSDGTFDLATRPAGLATMTAGIVSGPGRIRIVAKRMGSNGRTEWEVNEGPRLSNAIDVDPQTDITFTIRRVGGNINEPVANALIVFDQATPIQEFNLPPAPPSGGSSAYSTPSQAFFNNLRLNDQRTFASTSALGAVNQVSGSLDSIQLPDPPCGPDLFRRYTDASGRASVDLLGSARAGSGRGQALGLDWATFMTQQFRATECAGGNCSTMESIPLKFRALIYAAHRGAGEVNAQGEIPTVIEFSFDRQTRVFTIRNLRTGQTTTQTNSVNLTVQLPVLTGATSYVTIGAPFVFILPPGMGYVTRQTGGDYGERKATFSGFINFGFSPGTDEIPPTPDYDFQNAAPDFSIGFFHRPDAGGALTDARLYLGFPGNSNPPLYGNFTRATNTPLCTLQEDGSFGGGHFWQLTLRGADIRDPARLGALIPNAFADGQVSGRVEYRNAFGAVGTYPVEFRWSAPPREVFGIDEPVKVSDIKVGHVQYLGERSLGSGNRERTFPPEAGGNPLIGPREKRNETATKQYVNITQDGQIDGEASGSRTIVGDVAKQYNEGPRSRDKVVSVSGELANFGPRDYQTLLDEEVLLLQVTWGIPGLAGVDAYAAMRLLATYWFGGRAGVVNNQPYLEALTDATFSIALIMGIDIDVLFGLLFDAGVNIAGGIGSRLQTKYVSTTDNPQPDSCFSVFVNLSVYFDPCPICPTPAVTETYPVMGEGDDCPAPLGASDAAPLATRQQAQRGVGTVEQRSLRRHAAIRFDDRGNGGMMALDDNRRLTYTSLRADDERPPVVMSTAPGQRQPTIAFYAPNRAVSVWVENALSETELRNLNTIGYSSPGFPVAVRNQRLAWSKFNGSTWSPKQFLTLPGNGEAFPVLEACKDGSPGCPAGGSVFLAFQRNINGNFIAPRNRIFHASWTPAAGWSAVTAASAGADATQDITPSVVFVDGRPVLFWLRQNSANQLSLPRRLMWQFVGLGPAAGADLPDGANSLSLIAQTPEQGRNLFGAFVVPESNTGIIGSGQALYLLRGQCTVVSETCGIAFVKATVEGEPDSAVYGDRPLVSKTNSGRSIFMRVYSFTPKDAVAAKAAQSRAEAAFEVWRNATDPMHKEAALRGFQLNLNLGASADLYRMAANFVNGKVVPTMVTTDGGNYLGATGGYDQFTDRFVFAGAPIYADDTPVGLRAQAATGALSRAAPARTLGVVNGLEIRESDDVTDLRVDSVRLTRGTFGPSAALEAAVTVTNAGSAFTAATDGPVAVHLRLGAPTGRGAPLGSVAIPNLAAGERREFVVAFTTPATAFADEENMLYASLVLDADTPDLDGSNNFNVLPLPGLPVPTVLLASNRAGIPATQLQWRGSTDPRVVGYRIYRREAGGRFVPHGASTVEGFLDLSAQFGVMRTYAVSSYSSRGVESALSEPVSAAPEAVIAEPAGDAVFRNGFEALAP